MLDEFAKHASVNVVELLDIEATHAALVLAELSHQRLVRQGGPEIDDERGRARREAREARLAFVAARVAVVIAAESDDRRAPHLRRFPGDLAHHREQLVAVLALDLVLDLVDEL